MLTKQERIEGGLVGMLIGDALGVPYEFHCPEHLPFWDELEMLSPPGFPRSYPLVAPGTWSDDGAQALCLLESLLECETVNLDDFAERLLRWFDKGHLAVDNFVFDIGLQTNQALNRIRKGVHPAEAGLAGDRNNGNGSLMRVLPLVFFYDDNPDALIEAAAKQSLVTHAHIRSQLCCSLYTLWAHEELNGNQDGWESSVEYLKKYYNKDAARLKELNQEISPNPLPQGTGSGYVVDCLHSARLACQGEDFESVIKKAVSFGNDTDTTATVAGGIAGLRFGIKGIPKRWLKLLRGREMLDPLLERLLER